MRGYRLKQIGRVGGLLGALCLCGCVGTSVFTPYSRQAASLKDYLEQEDFEGACQYMQPKLKGQDRLLYLQERGRIYQLAGDLEKSKVDFEAASQIIEGRRFETNLGQTARTVGAVFLNDNTRPYEGWAYEKVFLHTYQALNYLEAKDLEGALVEIRRANNEQRYETERRALSQALLEAEAKAHNLDWQQEPESLQEVYKDLSPAIGAVKKTYQNGYTSYLSALVYELAGDRENARVSYRQALELYPGNTFVQEALRRTLEAKPAQQSQKGRLVVLYETGFIPQREQIKVPIPYQGRIYTVALPYLQASSGASRGPLRVSVGGKAYTTQELCQPGALAALALKEEYPGIVLRHLIRLIVRDQSQKQVQTWDEKQGLGGFLGFGVAILGFVLDHADLRSWSTLPHSVQLAEVYLEPGEQAVVLNAYGLEPVSLNIKIGAGQVRFLHLIKVGQRVDARVVL